MLTDKEFATIRTQTRNRAEHMKSARHWATSERSKYFDDKTCRKYTRDAVKNARKANRKIVAAKAAGSARPVSVVMAAVLPLMETFAKRAADGTLEHIAKVRAKVAAEGLDVAYPEPAPLAKEDRYNRAKEMARDLKIHARRFAANVCGLNEKITAEAAADEAVEDAVYNARYNFLAYAWKLDRKVGDVTAAKLTTVAGVWGESYLDVTMRDTGAVIRWKTQTITNHSVYGTPYFQWPTRIIKN